MTTLAARKRMQRAQTRALPRWREAQHSRVGVLAVSLLALTAHLHGGSAAHLMARDFSPPFVIVGMLTLCSLFFFVQLSHDEGAELRQR